MERYQIMTLVLCSCFSGHCILVATKFYDSGNIDVVTFISMTGYVLLPLLSFRLFLFFCPCLVESTRAPVVLVDAAIQFQFNIGL